jgi:hypothetical protein
MPRRRLLGRAVARAAAGPINLAVIGIGIAGAAVLGSWPILALGGAAYAALVASDLVSPEFRRRLVAGRPVTLSPPDRIADAATRDAAEAVRAALARVRATIEGTPERVRRHIQISVDALVELEGHAGALVERAEALAAYLASTDAGALRTQAESLADKARRTSDAQTRQQYEEAGAALDGQLRAIADIALSKERVLANLSRIAAMLSAIPAQLVRMRALDDQATDSLSGNVTAELDRMNIELKAFEQTLEDLQEVES